MATEVSPIDAAVALRSFPRRYREAVAPVTDGENLANLIHRPGFGGDSVFELTVNSARSMALLLPALRHVLTETMPVLHLAVVRRSAREFGAHQHQEIDDVLAELDDLCVAFAELVEHTATDDWTRPGGIAGGGATTALEIVQEAVSTAADNLREIEGTMRRWRGQ